MALPRRMMVCLSAVNWDEDPGVKYAAYRLCCQIKKDGELTRTFAVHTLECVASARFAWRTDNRRWARIDAVTEPPETRAVQLAHCCSGLGRAQSHVESRSIRV